MEPQLMSPRECSSGKEGEETRPGPPQAAFRLSGQTALVSSQSEREVNLCFQSTPSLRGKQPCLQGARH